MLLKFVKEKTMILPTPIGGLALAIASLGWAWENIFNDVVKASCRQPAIYFRSHLKY